MDKTREMILKKVAESLNLQQEIVEKIVSFQFADANKASHDNKEIEISGFGKFLLSRSKVKKKINKLSLIKERMENKKDSTKDYESRMESVINTLEFLKGKENEFQRKSDIGGVEK